jgi:cytoskeletal protein RodZ
MSFEGEIGEIDLIQRLVELGGETFTGAIRFESDGIIKIVYFKGGDILSASTNDRSDAIDEILQRANKVTREHVKQALAKRKESETLGDALLGLGFITRKELTWARRVQVIGILRSIIGWQTGSYTIVADYLPKREEGTIFPLSQIIVELVVTDTDRSKSEQAMESGNAVFEKAANFDDAFRRLGLNEDAEQIVAQIDGSSSAAEVAGRSGKDVFNVYKLLEALRLLRLVTRVGEPPVKHEVSAPAAWDVENPDFTLDDVAPTVAAVPVDHWAPDGSSTIEIPAWTPAAPQPEPKPAAHSVWDDPTDDDAFSATELAPPPIAPAAEPQWGFDEAQIEAARRAAVPVHANDEVPTSQPPVAESPSDPRRGPLMSLLLLLLVAVGGYGGWMWWQGRQTPTAVVMPRHTPPKLRNAGVPPAGPAASSPPITNTANAATPTTTTIAPIRVAAAPQTTSAAIVSKPVPVAAPVTKPISAKPLVIKPAPATTTMATHLERTNGGATITNTPQHTAASNSDPVRAKYDGMARDFAAQTGGSHTLQFELVCETSSITRAIAEAGDKVWFVPMSYRGRSCYRVFWGRFNSSAEATAATSQFPPALGVKPVVVKIPR